MVNTPETVSEPNLVAVFSESIDRRHEELTFLRDEFAKGMELVGDIDKVNEIIAAASRPDLTMTKRAEQMKLETPDHVDDVNNFVPRMRSFGNRVYGPRQKWDGTIEQKYIGRVGYTVEQRDELFQIGARGDMKQTLEFASEHEIDREFTHESFSSSIVNREAFLRMWIVVPELTEWLMGKCLSTVENRYGHIDEEIFVAYNLMSRLVDMNDRNATKDDGNADTWLLCH